MTWPPTASASTTSAAPSTRTIIERFYHLDQEETRERTEKSFFVPKQEIVDNGYDLSINKYKKVEYQAVEYPPTSEILAELESLQKEIDEGLKALKEML